jgi:hypothetical protein
MGHHPSPWPGAFRRVRNSINASNDVRPSKRSRAIPGFNTNRFENKRLKPVGRFERPILSNLLLVGRFSLCRFRISVLISNLLMMRPGDVLSLQPKCLQVAGSMICTCRCSDRFGPVTAPANTKCRFGSPLASCEPSKGLLRAKASVSPHIAFRRQGHPKAYLDLAALRIVLSP